MNKSDSILTSIKKLLGIDESYDVFDPDIIMHINSVFMTLSQLGVGPDEGFFIEDKNAIWSSYDSNVKLLNAVKTYIYLKVRLAFDPPASSAAIDSINRQINESEWRINVEAETSKTTQSTGEEVNQNE